MRVEIDIPANVRPEEARQAEAAARRAAMLELYRQGAVSAGRAAQDARLPLEDFLLLACAHGIPVLDLDPGELKRDTEAARRAGEAGR